MEAIGPSATTFPSDERRDAVADEVQALKVVGDHEDGKPEGSLQGSK